MDINKYHSQTIIPHYCALPKSHLRPCICMKSYGQIQQVTYLVINGFSEVVTHPSTNLTHGCLTSVFNCHIFPVSPIGLAHLGEIYVGMCLLLNHSIREWVTTFSCCNIYDLLILIYKFTKKKKMYVKIILEHNVKLLYKYQFYKCQPHTACSFCSVTCPKALHELYLFIVVIIPYWFTNLKVVSRYRSTKPEIIDIQLPIPRLLTAVIYKYYCC